MKEKKGTTTHTSSFLNTKEKIIGACIASGVIVILIAVLMIIESNNGKITVKNNTDLKLEYVNTSFVYSTEDNSVDEFKNFKEIKANSTETLKFEPVNLLYSGANLEISFKFENKDELFVDAGIFNDKLTGKVKISFQQTKDSNVLKLKVTAKNGILPSATIDCNEEYTVNLNDGTISE